MPEKIARVIGIKSTIAMFKKPRIKIRICTILPMKVQKKE